MSWLWSLLGWRRLPCGHWRGSDSTALPLCLTCMLYSPDRLPDDQPYDAWPPACDRDDRYSLGLFRSEYE